MHRCSRSYLTRTSRRPARSCSCRTTSAPTRPPPFTQPSRPQRTAASSNGSNGTTRPSMAVGWTWLKANSACCHASAFLGGVDAAGKATLKRKLRGEEVIPFFEQQERCTVVLEACGAGHHWARILTQLGHEAKLLAPEAARPFVKKDKKNDAADAAALCAAASQPEVRFVPVKSPEQQGVLALHSVRLLLVKQQTMLANAMRGLATEFGLVVAKGIHKLDELEAQVKAEASMPATAKQAFAELHGRSQAAAARIAGLEAQIVAHVRQDATARRLATIPGIGPITASLITATVGDAIGSFKSARHFAAWLGLVPRQHSTGGKTRLGRITKA